ncbi:MAG TPA: hypothetical protein VJ803_07505 [Gemmatimonadaceae bacterium]|nr:hypothetical protein [Gemmatimonadaceae bacterium]
MRSRLLLVPALAAALGALATHPAGAQSARLVSFANHADSARAELPIGEMRSRLRWLVVSQEAYHADHGTYTTDLGALGMKPASRVTPRDSIMLQVVHAGGRSWTARAIYRVRGRELRASCVIYVGDPRDFPSQVTTDRVGAHPTEAGVPLCDR